MTTQKTRNRLQVQDINSQFNTNSLHVDASPVHYPGSQPETPLHNKHSLLQINSKPHSNQWKGQKLPL